MIEFTSLPSAIECLRSAGELINGLAALRKKPKGAIELGELGAVLIEALAFVARAQSEMAALQKESRELHARVLQMQDWTQEKERYGLEQLAPGVLAYAIKPACRGEQPPHHLCPRCYEDGVKSILQRELGAPRNGTSTELARCPRGCPALVLSGFGP